MPRERLCVPDEVWHSAMRWNAPLSEAHAATLLDACELGGEERVLDLGCGWGELLLRAVERSRESTGIGVENDRRALRRGRELITARGLGGRVALREADAGTWSEPADRVVCVGASHVWGGTAPALAALTRLVSAGGRLLYGDGHLEPGSSPATREIFGELPSFDGVLRLAVAAGWRVLHASVADQLEWDEFESTHRGSVERWLLAHPETVGAAEIRDWLDRRRREYVEGYRGELGFCWLVLGRDESRSAG